MSLPARRHDIGAITFTIPIKATNSLNARLHWAARARAVKKEKAQTAIAFLAAGGHLADFAPPLVVRLTRIGPRKLDGDNLQGTLKAVRDALAHKLGVDDGSDAVRWEYAQERGPYAVRVEIERVDNPSDAP